jgi:hypothetical protein
MLGVWAAVVPALALWPMLQRARLQIHNEELNSAVVGPLWFTERTIYDGTNCNLGWYALVAARQALLGFDLLGGRQLRLVLLVAGLLAAHGLLRRRCTPWVAALLVVLYGLSPSLLYFNTLQTEYGLDLTMLPIIGWALAAARQGALGWTALAGAFAMAGCLCYPVFLFYLPGLLWWQLAIWRSHEVRAGWPIWIAGIGGMALPLLAMIFWLEEPARWFHDARTQSGAFRGGGVPVGFSLDVMSRAVTRTLADLVLRGESYYFELPACDFRPPLAWIALVGGFAVSTWLARYGPSSEAAFIKRLAGPLALTAVLHLLLPSCDDRYPGLRRSTGLLLVAHLIVGLPWMIDLHRSRWLAMVSRWPLVVLLVSHISAYPINLAQIARPSPWAEQFWFEHADGPRAALERWQQVVLAGRPLLRQDAQGRRWSSDYQGIYAALASLQRWGAAPQRPILGVDPRSGRVLPLEIALWREWVFEH